MNEKHLFNLIMYVYIFPKLGVWAESVPSLTWKCGAGEENAGFYFHDNYFVYNTAGCHVWRCIGGGCVCFFVFQAFSDSYRTALHVFRLKLLHTQHSSIRNGGIIFAVSPFAMKNEFDTKNCILCLLIDIQTNAGMKENQAKWKLQKYSWENNSKNLTHSENLNFKLNSFRFIFEWSGTKRVPTCGPHYIWSH